MNLASLLTTALAAAEVKQLGPRLARRALAYGLLALAIVCLMVVVWRVLELAFGPLLGPLVAALLLALASAAVFLWIEKPDRRHAAPTGELFATTAVLAPLAATVVAPLVLPALKFLLHPKRLAMLAVVGSVAAGVGMVGKPSAARRRPPRPTRTSV